MTTSQAFQTPFSTVDLATRFVKRDFSGLVGMELPDPLDELTVKSIDSWDFSVYDEFEAEEGSYLRFEISATLKYGKTTLKESFTLWISEADGRASITDLEKSNAIEIPVELKLVAPLLTRLKLA